jgi:hypothetical protein
MPISVVGSNGLPSGSVLQVKSIDSDLNLSHTAAVQTPTDTGIGAISMTRTQNSSKFLISLTGGRARVRASAGYNVYFYAKEGTGSYASVATGTDEEQSLSFLFTNMSTDNIQVPHSSQFLYTPTSSTADCDFKVYFTRFGNTSTSTEFNIHDSNAGARLHFTVTEIAG